MHKRQPAEQKSNHRQVTEAMVLLAGVVLVGSLSRSSAQGPAPHFPPAGPKATCVGLDFHVLDVDPVKHQEKVQFNTGYALFYDTELVSITYNFGDGSEVTESETLMSPNENSVVVVHDYPITAANRHYTVSSVLNYVVAGSNIIRHSSDANMACSLDLTTGNLSEFAPAPTSSPLVLANT